MRKFLPYRCVGEKNLFLVIISVLGHPNGVGGTNFNFLGGKGMDVFWNDPMKNIQYDDKCIYFQVWDIGGQPRFRSMWERYCRGVNCIV